MSNWRDSTTDEAIASGKWHQGIPYSAVVQLTSENRLAPTPPTELRLPKPSAEPWISEKLMPVITAVIGIGVAVGFVIALRDYFPWGIITAVIVLTLIAVKIFTSRKDDAGFYHEFHVAEVADPVTREEWARLTPSGPHPAEITDRRTSLTFENGQVNRFALQLTLADGTELTARWRGDPIMPTQVPVVGGKARVWFLPGSDVRVVEVLDPTGEFDPAE